MVVSILGALPLSERSPRIAIYLYEPRYSALLPTVCLPEWNEIEFTGSWLHGWLVAPSTGAVYEVVVVVVEQQHVDDEEETV